MDDFITTIEPFRMDRDKWWVEYPIKNISELKPDPDNDVLLIVGDGWNVLDDLESFLKFGADFDTMIMNYVGKTLPASWKVHHYIAGDSHTKPMQEQAARYSGNGTLRHCWNRGSKNFDIRWGRNTSKGWTGTTANLGIKIGIAMGYMKIVLAGCPMDNGGNWYTKGLANNDVKRLKDHTAHLWKWNEIASRPIGRFIRSMSGNTARLFGEPDENWLFN